MVWCLLYRLCGSVMLCLGGDPVIPCHWLNRNSCGFPVCCSFCIYSIQCARDTISIAPYSLIRCLWTFPGGLVFLQSHYFLQGNTDFSWMLLRFSADLFTEKIQMALNGNQIKLVWLGASLTLTKELMSTLKLPVESSLSSEYTGPMFKKKTLLMLGVTTKWKVHF